MRLNLGCGRDILVGWVNLDLSPLDGVDVVADLSKPLPFPDGCVEEFLLSHVIEHIKDPLALMGELYRIAAPAAQMTIRVPHGASDDAWEDPTHVRPYFPGSFMAFGQPYYWRADYGYSGDWRVDCLMISVDAERFANSTAEEINRAMALERNVVKEMTAHLTAIKPMRAQCRTQFNTPEMQFCLE